MIEAVKVEFYSEGYLQLEKPVDETAVEPAIPYGGNSRWSKRTI